METLLRNVTHRDLEAIFTRTKKNSPVPYLFDKKVVNQARKWAKLEGIWDEIDSFMQQDKTIPVIKRSVYRSYQRTGDRQEYEGQRGRRNRALFNAYLAVWLGHPRADVDFLQDLLWAWCDEWNWVMNAHETHCATDLGSNMQGAWMAEIIHVLGDTLEPEVTERVTSEIEERIFKNIWDHRKLAWWKTVQMNWNHVCNGDYIRTALYLEKDPEVLANLVHGALQYMTYALDGFTDDGGCQEGPGYWGYGFGHYLFAAFALYNKTGGKLNIMQGEKLERICRYPLAAHITGPHYAPFADCGVRWLSTLNVILINKFFDIPELFELCQPSDRRIVGLARDRLGKQGVVKLYGIHALALYEGQRTTGRIDNADYVLPDLGQVKLKSKPGRKQLTLMALAGNNEVPHNHNDIGSFAVARKGEMLLTDPGAPVYCKDTFNDDVRYNILFCRSRGHSVPLINGREQEMGARYYGTLEVDNLNGKGEKRAYIDMSKAYPKGVVKSLLRVFTVDTEKHTIRLEDSFTFKRTPRKLEEAFITYQPVRVIAGGRSVQIGPASRGLHLAAFGTPGIFRAERLVEESKAGRGEGVVTRITFKPKNLSTRMQLAFILS